MGCGNGGSVPFVPGNIALRVLLDLAHAQAKVIGVDISPHMHPEDLPDNLILQVCCISLRNVYQLELGIRAMIGCNQSTVRSTRKGTIEVRSTIKPQRRSYLRQHSTVDAQSLVEENEKRKRGQCLAMKPCGLRTSSPKISGSAIGSTMTHVDSLRYRRSGQIEAQHGGSLCTAVFYLEREENHAVHSPNGIQDRDSA